MINTDFIRDYPCLQQARQELNQRYLRAINILQPLICINYTKR